MSQADWIDLSKGVSVITFFVLLVLYGAESMKKMRTDIKKSYQKSISTILNFS